MAIVHPIGQPDTESERLAIRFLAQHLSDDYIIIHNLEIPNRSGFAYEVDLIVIAPHAVYVIEEKGYSGHIVGNPHQWRLASGVVVPSPIPQINKKVRIIGTRLKSVDRTLNNVFFESLVLLTDPQATIDLRDRQADRVVPLSQLPEVLSDPARLSIDAKPLGDRARRVFELLTSQAEPLQRKRDIGVYRIIEPIGETAEYREYLAEHRYLVSDPRARLKVYHFDAYQGPDRRARQIELIMRDINALRCLAGHPNIAQAVDIFPWESHYFVMVTEWIDGDTLRARLENRDGPLDNREVIHLARQIGRGLMHAHNHGVIHRDLRPENIIIARDRRVKLTNFDCARVSISKADTIAGQVSAFWDERYVAPEALLDPRHASAMSDLYSLGVVLYECLVGELPYSSIADILKSARFDRLPSKSRSSIDPKWDSIIMHLCNFDRQQRYQRASDVLQDIETLCDAGIVQQ
ncbi:MAG: hypothetical protein Kow0074_14930 [Candidatus Zixiibacteriota bacterium]